MLSPLSYFRVTTAGPVNRCPLYVRSRSEQDGHNQSMWEADFGAVYSAIADCLDEREWCMVSRVEYC